MWFVIATAIAFVVALTILGVWLLRNAAHQLCSEDAVSRQIVRRDPGYFAEGLNLVLIGALIVIATVSAVNYLYNIPGILSTLGSFAGLLYSLVAAYIIWMCVPNRFLKKGGTLKQV